MYSLTATLNALELLSEITTLDAGMVEGKAGGRKGFGKDALSMYGMGSSEVVRETGPASSSGASGTACTTMVTTAGTEVRLNTDLTV